MRFPFRTHTFLTWEWANRANNFFFHLFILGERILRRHGYRYQSRQRTTDKVRAMLWIVKFASEYATVWSHAQKVTDRNNGASHLLAFKSYRVIRLNRQCTDVQIWLHERSNWNVLHANSIFSARIRCSSISGTLYTKKVMNDTV